MRPDGIWRISAGELRHDVARAHKSRRVPSPLPGLGINTWTINHGFRSPASNFTRGYSPAPLRGDWKTNWRVPALVLVGLFGTLGGCAYSRQYEPSVDPNTLSDVQFVHYLVTVPVVTVEEGCRAVMIAADGEDSFSDHGERYAAMEQRGLVRAAWKLEGQQVLDTGTLAFMLSKVCSLPPSVNSVLLGSWGLGDRRYALKQAVRYNLIRYAPPYKSVTGGEMVAALASADEYMARHGVYELPEAVEADLVRPPPVK